VLRSRICGRRTHRSDRCDAQKTGRSSGTLRVQTTVVTVRRTVGPRGLMTRTYTGRCGLRRSTSIVIPLRLRPVHEGRHLKWRTGLSQNITVHKRTIVSSIGPVETDLCLGPPNTVPHHSAMSCFPSDRAPVGRANRSDGDWELTQRHRPLIQVTSALAHNASNAKYHYS